MKKAIIFVLWSIYYCFWDIIMFITKDLLLLKLKIYFYPINMKYNMRNLGLLISKYKDCDNKFTPKNLIT